MPIEDGNGNELFPINKGDRLLVAAYLLQAYDKRLGATERLQAVAASGEKAYGESMTQLAGLVIKLHPALMPNINAEHRPKYKVRVVWHDAASPPGGEIVHRLIALDEYLPDKMERYAVECDIANGTGSWVKKDGKSFNVFVPAKAGGYDADDLRQAFRRISPKKGWKNPIKARVPKADFDMLDAASCFITGGPLTITREHPDGTVDVRGDGYYSNVGA